MSVTIFEGPDGAGKSTLIAAWQRRLEAKHGIAARISAHGPYLGLTDIAPHYLRDCVAALRGGQVLMDRSWLSEPIYGPIARGKNRLTVASRRMLERAALGAGALVVRCLPPFETCRGNYLARKHLEYLPDDSTLKAVWEAYARENVWATFQTLTYDYTRESSKIAFTDMAEHLRRGKNAGPGVGRFSSGVTLLVGEQVSEATAAADFPFISDDPTGCTAWLSQRLEEWGVPESALYWVNALTARGTATAGGTWLALLAPKRVIALGAVAQQWCLEHSLPFEAIPHPQYWRRFNSSQPYPLRELLT